MASHHVQLRLESPDGSVAREYRVSDGKVETRRQEAEARYGPEGSWHRLTPQQLSDHVKHSTVVSHWLQRRLGWRRLLRMCVAQSPDWTPTHNSAPEDPRRNADYLSSLSLASRANASHRPVPQDDPSLPSAAFRFLRGLSVK